MTPLIPVLSMQVTYQCNIACKHCGPYCAPEERDWMSPEEIRALISQAAEAGAGLVVFTGGEPSLLGADLPPLIRFVHDKGVATSRVVTNAKFASSYEKASRVLRAWQDAGLVEVNFSCGEFHQEFVPMDHVANAYRAACELGFRTVLLAGEFLAAGKGKLDPEMFEEALGRRLMRSSSMSPFSDYHHGIAVGEAMPYGRGREFIGTDAITLHPTDKIRSCCDDVLQVFTVHPNGNTTACCGIMVRAESLLNIGNWRETSLRELAARAQNDLVLNWIKYRGLRDMKSWLEQRDSALGLRDRYQNICDLCAELVYNTRVQEHLVNASSEMREQIVQAKIATDAAVGAGRFIYGPSESNDTPTHP